MYAKPIKSLGQNFLIDKNIRNKIISACDFKPADIVLEIGSGKGELTGMAAKTCSKVFALELDSGLCGILKNSLKEYDNVTIINKDILKFDISGNFNKEAGKIKILGNIPYYISSPIIEHLLKFKDIIDSIFITVQKEFAARVVASAGSKDYGSFSCFTQYYTIPKRLFFIKKTSFFPSPSVDSCFLRLDIRRRPAVETDDEGLLFKVIRAAFNKRRKTLRNSLSEIVTKENLGLFFSSYKLNPNIRPEEMCLQDFANLTKILKN